MKRIIYLLAISCFLLISCHDDDRFSVENVVGDNTSIVGMWLREAGKEQNEMKLDDYGFGLFEYNGVLYFKEADEGRCFDVRSGNEAIIGKDKIVTALED